jgi:stearoyl-CoA desaturase (delta-9 desaturase)
MYEAYAGWYLHKTYAAHIDPALQSKDLIKDPLYRFLEQGGDWHRAHILAFSISCVVRLTMFLLFGWQITLANMLGSFLVLHLPQMLNVVCHLPKLGYKNYDDGSDSVNVWWVGLLALGEGWHNNHHTDPGSARSGVHFWEFDLSWHVLRLLRAVGLVTRVNEKSHLQLLQRSKVRIARSLELREKAIAIATAPQLVPVYAVSSANNK